MSSQQIWDSQSFVAVTNMVRFICPHYVTGLNAFILGKHWFRATVPSVQVLFMVQ